MSDTVTRQAELRQTHVEPSLVDLWLRVALARSYGPPVTAPLPEALRHLVDGD